MDNKSSDDSVGSDSLDKSLLKKCVVDDAGDGVQHAVLDDELPCCSKSLKNVSSKKLTDHQKTEKGIGDGVGVLQETASKDKNSNLCNTATSSNSPALLTVSSGSRSSMQEEVTPALQMETKNNSSSNTISSSSPAFETKVKQISDDLMETSLMDVDLTDNVAFETSKEKLDATSEFGGKVNQSETLSTSSNSSAVSYQATYVDKGGAQELQTPSSVELPSTSKAAAIRLRTEAIELETESSRCSIDVNEDNDPNSNNSKKVRFHPEVKEHDGGVRVIPKKKKKSKEAKQVDYEMEQDDEEDEQETEAIDEDYSISKIIEEAEEYIKENPLFIDRSAETPNIPEGLYEEEDEKYLEEEEDEVDYYANCAPPENGVERVLGKLINKNKVLYLVRYVEKARVSWETEEFVLKQCPTILEDYEVHRQAMQESLMNYVAKRKKFRQRYTDF